MAEETVYSDSQVSVTTARVIIGATTYALRNITSVKMAVTPAKMGCAIVLLIVGGLFLLGGLAGFATSIQQGIVGSLFAALIIGLAIIWMKSAKATYHVAIASASGEAHAFSSTDQNHIQTIVSAINNAIVQYR